MVKYTLLIGIILSGWTIEVFGQKHLHQTADAFYANFEYTDAVKLYEKILKGEKDFLVMLKTAKCYEKLNNPVKAELWYKRAQKLSRLKSSDKFGLAMSLTQNKKYDEAIYWFENYAEEVKDNRALHYIQALTNIKALMADSAYMKVRHMDFNSKNADFSPMFYNDGLVYVSARRERVFSKSLHAWNYKPFLNLYYTDFKNKPQYFHKQVNSKYHEGPLTFYDDQRKALITRNDFHNGKSDKSEDGILKLNIYAAERRGAHWLVTKELPFNDNEHSHGHPTVTKDGRYLYIASDQPGGFGGTDLYVCTWQNGQWSEPVNLGDKINTAGNELFPYIHDDGLLYFASNGLGGLGGLDIFSAQLDNAHQAQWVKNMGYPLNTEADDFGLIINKDKSTGYFSSNRKGGKGDDDIYQIRFIQKGIKVDGKVIDQITRLPLPNVRIQILRDGIEEEYLLSDASGDFSFTIQPNEFYRKIFKKSHYETVKDSLNTAGLKLGDRFELLIEMVPADLLVQAKVVRKETKLPFGKNEAEITLKNETTGRVDSLTIDNEGELELPLQPESNYLLKAFKPQHFTLSQRFSTKKLTEPTTINFELPMQKIEVNKPVKIENIYYDFDKANIRADAVPELEKLFSLLDDNRNVKVEISSHTDARGDWLYNQDLSQKRAESVVQYLIQKGITEERLVAKGYGESRLLNYCKDNSICDEADHQVNRRTEFKVVQIYTRDFEMLGLSEEDEENKEEVEDKDSYR
ncbi:MAG: OmpA family protein [Bacteroidota bacterium]